MIWLTAVAVLGVGVVVSRASYGPLDDPNQAYQRPGFLDASPLPAHPPQVTPTVPSPGTRAVVFFVRPAEAQGLVDALRADTGLGRLARVAVVDSGGQLPASAVPVVLDRSGGLARAYGMRSPIDGGYPVGYAVVDSNGRVRYATIDPGVAQRLTEVATIVRATP
ncbi:MAG: hypothetical protein ACYC1D_10360 [Acidimicrobiales bacterium]